MKNLVFPITISKVGDSIEPDTRFPNYFIDGKDNNGNDCLYDHMVATHVLCEGVVEIQPISSINHSLVCRVCGRLAVFPVTVSTWKELIKYFWAFTEEPFEKIYKEIKDELDSSLKQHEPLKSPRDGHSILQEEYEEFWEAIKSDNIPQAVKEAKQVAAMAIKFIHAYE